MQQLQSIIAVTDLTHASDACLQTASNIARATGARLRVVNAQAGQLPLTDYLRLVFTPNRFAGAQADALQQQLERALHTSIQAEVEAILDPTPDWVLQQVRAEADLIVVSRSVSSELLTALAERALLPTLIVGRELQLPISKAVMPVGTPVPNQEAMRCAKVWTELLAAPPSNATADAVELELLQLVYISAESGAAAAAVRALRGAAPDMSRVKLSWRASSAEPPARQVRRLAERDDAELIITTVKVTRETAASGKLSSLNRSIVRACAQPVLILPVTRQRAVAIA